MLRRPLGQTVDSNQGVRVTFLGNSTFVIRDKDTVLVVDGFVSRPGPLRTLFGRIDTDKSVVRDVFETAGVRKIDALLVGHAHHDHALDATFISDEWQAPVMGSASFGWIYQGNHDPNKPSLFSVVPKEGLSREFGKFKVSFRNSGHVGSHSPFQSIIENEITSPVSLPAHYSRFKCGEVFVIHIGHPDGSMVITTTAGAADNQLDGLQADVCFLGIGFLSKESDSARETYWKETVASTCPSLIVPIHWDNFSRPLSVPLKPIALSGNNRKVLDFMKMKATDQEIRAMDDGETLTLRKGVVYFNPKQTLENSE